MRELINLLESVGLANRRPGDRWSNNQGDEIIFSDLTFYPESGAFDDVDAMNSAIAEVAQSIGVTPGSITWTNQPRGALAFAIAHFVDADNQDYYLGRYFRSISPNARENNFPNDLPGGFQLQTKAAKKERAGYKPSDVLTRLDRLTPQDIYDQIAERFGADSSEAQATAAFMSATGTSDIAMPLGNMDFAAFTNYFAEMLQPMALVMGKARRGNADEAESKFLTEGGFDTCVISFGGSKIGGLVDSTLTNPAGQILGLSSKAKDGAKASAKNLKEKVDEMRTDPDGRAILEKYREEVAVLEMIVEGGYLNGPLNLAMTYDIIKPEEKQQILALRKLSLGDFREDMLSDNLQDLWNSRSAADPSTISPFYHMLAAVAYPVANYINDNTNFSRAASDILNFGAFIQAQTHAAQKGGNIILKPFDYTYPSTAVTGVILSAHKTYYSTGNKGNFTFKILKNGATEKDIEVTDQQVDTKPDVDLDQITQRRSSVKAFREPDASDEKTLGRQRRR